MSSYIGTFKVFPRIPVTDLECPGEPDVFVHMTAVRNSKLTGLKPCDRVEFDLRVTDSKRAWCRVLENGSALL